MNEGDVKESERVVIRSFPKIVYFYPTLVTAILAAIWTKISLAKLGGDFANVSLGPGRVFMVIFAFNLLILAFDFSRKGFTAVVLSAALFVTLGLLVEAKVPVFEWLERFLSVFQLRAHPHFYAVTAFVLALLIGAAVLDAQFTYWEIRSNEILHHQGLMADVERFPAPGLRFKKSIPDVFEYALLRAGTITLMPQGEKHEIQDVPNVNVIERRLDGLLGAISVQIRKEESDPAAPPLPPAAPLS